MTTRLLFLLAAALLCWAAPAQGQTIKSLGYNTTNGQVVYGGTNDLTFTNSVFAPQFSGKIGTNLFVSIADDIAEFYVSIDVRSSNGITFSATNSAAATRTNLGLYATNQASVRYAIALFDQANDTESLRVEDGIMVFSADTIKTNSPADATNAVRWIEVNEIGSTNVYKLPLYQ